jgi:hypothetical protein
VGESIQAIIASKKKAMIPARLEKGAAVLGRLWQEEVRCLSGWSGICPCESPNDFCLGKKKWLSLVKELYDGKYPYGLSGTEGFLVLECMTERMFIASGLTIVKNVPGAQAPIRIGRKGTVFQTILDLESIYESDPAVYNDAVQAVVKIQAIL